MPGGQVVRRLTLDEEILGSNPSQAAKIKSGLMSTFYFGYLTGTNLRDRREQVRSCFSRRKREARFRRENGAIWQSQKRLLARYQIINIKLKLVYF